eukprot:c14430_g1_i1 orf=145-1095(+)
MPTFHALQCYNCGAMQVKQEKKSSNKWSCCICNEKQSVRKVFARSEAAKDIRMFVQEFNYSKGVLEAEVVASNIQIAGCMNDLDAEGWSQGFPDVKEFVERRSKWLEYLEEMPAAVEPLQDKCEGVNVVTAIPENIHGKRKCRGLTSCETICDDYKCKLTSSWTKTKRMSSSNRESLETDSTLFTHSCSSNQGTSAETFKSSKQDLCRSWPVQNLIQGNLFHKPSANLYMPTLETGNAGFEIAANRTSKWEEYLLPDMENFQGGMPSKICNSWGSKSCLEGSDKVEFHDLVTAELTSTYPDELVDEEVHPQFFTEH